ncbi:MAG: hypothetical protein ACREEJ_15410, partial [Ensifer adhaerens]
MQLYARIGLATCLALSSATITSAADITPLLAPAAQPEETESGWQFTVAPYFWIAGLTGDVAQFGLPDVHIDSSFSDIWDNLDFAFMAMGEARNDPYSIFGDVMYTKLSADGNTPNGLLANSVEVDSTTFAALLAVGYSIYEDQSSHLDIVGGLKVWSVDTTLSFSGGLLDGVSRDDGATWVDAVSGLR